MKYVEKIIYGNDRNIYHIINDLYKKDEKLPISFDVYFDSGYKKSRYGAYYKETWRCNDWNSYLENVHNNLVLARNIYKRKKDVKYKVHYIQYSYYED